MCLRGVKLSTRACLWCCPCSLNVHDLSACRTTNVLIKPRSPQNQERLVTANKHSYRPVCLPSYSHADSKCHTVPCAHAPIWLMFLPPHSYALFDRKWNSSISTLDSHHHCPTLNWWIIFMFLLCRCWLFGHLSPFIHSFILLISMVLVFVFVPSSETHPSVWAPCSLHPLHRNDCNCGCGLVLVVGAGVPESKVWEEFISA